MKYPRIHMSANSLQRDGVFKDHLTGGAVGVSLQCFGEDNFTVIYGLQVKKNLTYSQACDELGRCIMHAVACDALINNN